MAKRKAIPDKRLTEVLVRSKRRCCLCFYLDDDDAIKDGQISHLDRDPSNNKLDNLAFLCLPHHNAYDSKPSQAKGLTIGEVKYARELLREALSPVAGTQLVEIRLGRPFASFKPVDQDRLLRDIKDSLMLDREIKVLRTRPGSVIMTADVAASDAQRLVKAFMDGKLDRFDVVDLRLIRFIDADSERASSTLASQLDLTRTDIGELKAMLNELLADKRVGDEPPRQPTGEELAAAAEVLRRGDALAKSKAALVERDFEAHRRFLAEAMKPVLAEAFELLTLEGDGYYHERKFDEAVGPYEKACSLRPDDIEARKNLALALQQTHRRPRTEDLRRAISLHERTLCDLPPGTPLWGATQNNLGAAWRDLPTGDRGENLSKAIECYRSALEVLTRDADPVGWAMMQNNLGAAWSELPTRDRGENLSKAIEFCRSALEVRTRDADPVGWAMTQNNLGIAWRNLPTGDRGEDLSKAIECFRSALQVYTREAHPVDWAMTQNNLGNAWSDLPTGDRGENLSRAIECFRNALEVRTRDADPVKWAMTQNNLGTAWRNLPTGDRGEDLSKAIEYFRSALEVRTRDADPVEWAITQNNLGNAWLNLPTGDRGENLSKAIECYRRALEVLTADAFPHQHGIVARNLKRLEQERPPR